MLLNTTHISYILLNTANMEDRSTICVLPSLWTWTPPTNCRSVFAFNHIIWNMHCAIAFSSDTLVLLTSQCFLIQNRCSTPAWQSKSISFCNMTFFSSVGILLLRCSTNSFSFFIITIIFEFNTRVTHSILFQNGGKYQEYRHWYNLIEEWHCSSPNLRGRHRRRL